MSRPAGFHQTEATKAKISAGLHKLSDSRYGTAPALEPCDRCGQPISSTMRAQARYMGGGAFCSWNCSNAAEAEAPGQEKGKLS
jgi:RNA polymerase-binding transcription factor DksA